MCCADLAERSSVNAMRQICRDVRALLADRMGATAIEYALVAIIISLSIVGALPLIGGFLKDTFTSITTGL